MFNFIKNNSYVNSERIDHACEQIVKYADNVGLTGLVLKVNNAVSPYFQSDQMPGRLWHAIREKITTSSYAVRAIGVFSFTIIAVGCAYYKMKKNEQQERVNADHSQESDEVSEEDVRKRLNELNSGVCRESLNQANMNHLLAHLNTIRNLDALLAGEVLLFVNESVAGTDVKGRVDYMKKRSDEMEIRIEKMVNDLAVAFIRDDLDSDAPISEDQIEEYKQTYLEMFRENAILALEKEANGVASEAYFERELSSKFEWKKMKDDGDCFFHAIGFNVNEDQAAVRENLLAEKLLKKQLDDSERNKILKSAKEGGDQGVSTDAFYLANHYQCCIEIHSHMDPQKSTVGKQFASNRTIHLYYNGLNHWDTLIAKK